jgi:hypothetical protein
MFKNVKKFRHYFVKFWNYFFPKGENSAQSGHPVYDDFPSSKKFDAKKVKFIANLHA